MLYFICIYVSDAKISPRSLDSCISRNKNYSLFDENIRLCSTLYTENNLNLRIKTGPVTAGAEATVLIHICPRNSIVEITSAKEYILVIIVGHS